jgi:assimilatory nitrate reductase electron transfer subunit
MARHVVLVGHGMVGDRFIEEIRRRDPDGTRVRLTVLGAEPRGGYNRILLPSLLSGAMLDDDLFPPDAPAGLPADRPVLRPGTAATVLDRPARAVLTSEGGLVRYDDLVLATGAAPRIPDIPGLDRSVTPLRTVADARRVGSLALQARRKHGRLVVLGGGVLGLETARALVARGTAVTVVHPGRHPMERQVDAPGGRILAAALRRTGVDIELGVGASWWEPGHGLWIVPSGGTTPSGSDRSAVPGDTPGPRRGRTAVLSRELPPDPRTPRRLSDEGANISDRRGARLIPATGMVLSAGAVPDSGLARDAGLRLTARGGIAVDDTLATSDPHVYAIGDCAGHPGAPGGLVQPGWEQAAVLAARLTGDTRARYRGSTVVTRLKAAGIELTCLGDPLTEDGEPDCEVLSFADPARERYAKLMLADDRVTGAILIGLPDAAAGITQVYDRGAPAPADRLALLLGRALPPDAPGGGGPAALPDHAIVCRCNMVTKAALRDAWYRGATCARDLSSATRAATGCGSCGDDVAGFATWLAAVSSEETGPNQKEAQLA